MKKVKNGCVVPFAIPRVIKPSYPKAIRYYLN